MSGKGELCYQMEFAQTAYMLYTDSQGTINFC